MGAMTRWPIWIPLLALGAVIAAAHHAVGLCLLFGGLRHHEQSFRHEGATAALAARTNVLQGAVHLVIFAAFLFLSLVH